MELLDIYNGLKENMDELGPRKADLEKMVNDYQLMVDKYQRLLSGATLELKDITDREFALKSAMENLELIDVKAPIKEETENEKENDTDTLYGAKVIKRPVKQPQFTKKSARLGRYDRNDELIESYATQAAAARTLGWDQSSVSRFLKFEKDTQIRKKNFYFKWIY